MATRRRKDVQVNLETTIYQLFVDLAARSGMTQSGFLRKLVIEELRSQGLLTDAMLADIMAGSS